MAKKRIQRRRFGYAILFIVILSSCYLQYCSYAATDTISLDHQLTISDTIVSAKESFELGFFRPSNESEDYYVGIWFSYKKIPEQTVVWVANREFPVNSSAVLAIEEDGSLVIKDGRNPYTVANISTNYETRARATLLDSGNLVVRDENSSTLWQSFDHPTDTLLATMRIGYEKHSGKTWSFISWKSKTDPAPGGFSMMVDPDGTNQVLIKKGSQIYWSSGQWNGQIFSLLPEMTVSYMYKPNYVSNENETYFSYNLCYESVITLLVIDASGQMQQRLWLESTKEWSVLWSKPEKCEVYGYCGAFASCNKVGFPLCNCLRGFEQVNPKNWAMESYNEGCTRKSSLLCNSTNVPSTSQDRFSPTSNILAANPQMWVVRSFQECESSCLNNCNCTAFAYSDNNCSTWRGELINLQEVNNSSVGKLYLRLAASEFNDAGTKSTKKIWIVIVSSISVIFILLSVLLYWVRKKRGHAQVAGVDLLSFDFSVNPGGNKYEMKECTTEEGKKEVEIPLFSLSSVSAATDGFSSANKLGEGGFGPVYKGKLINGYEVAVKRLSRRSGQGWEELKNEAMLIAKLQHKNLVKLLGCCIDGDEKMLVYEYLPNTSLDFFLFGSSKEVLDWASRVRIIEGIAQGLLYLHEFSRVQIIHRDLKASNILLDGDMNPKISDFGMARIFGGQESQATNRIVGTYGYMSPEYALEGIFSVKSDIFSFGVVLLEIVSGKKNTGFYQSDSLNLLGHTWDLWRNEKALELVDPILQNISPAKAPMRYINIALLCVQEHASDRPAMSDVVLMLTNDGAVLPSPKQPAFSNSRGVSDTSKCNRNQEEYSANELTISVVNAR